LIPLVAIAPDRLCPTTWWSKEA